MSSTGFQRKLDLAPTASIDKVALNNRVVLMRAVVRRSKLHLINALVKRVHKLRDKKGTEDQKSQNKNKADRMLEDIKIIKVLKPDYVSKYALSTTEKFEDLAAKSSTTAEMRALARLAAQKFITQEVVKFRSEHEDWKELAAYLMTKHTSREFKKKKTKEKMKKVETNMKASENLVQKYLGEKLEGISDLDSEHNESESDDDNDGGDSNNDSDEADQKVNDNDEKRNNNLVNDRGRSDSFRTESKTVESVRKTSVNLNYSSLKNKGILKQTEKKRMETFIQDEERNENIDSNSEEENISRMTDNSNESEADDNDDDNEAQDDDDGTDESNDDGDDNDDDDDDGGDDDDQSSGRDSDNELEHSEKQTTNNPSKHNAKFLDNKKNKPNSKGLVSKKSKHEHKGTRSDEFTKITEKRNTVKEKVEGEMIVKKLNLAKDFVEDEIPKILLSDNEDRPTKRKKKMKDLFFDTGEDDDRRSHDKAETELDDGDNETTDNSVGGNFERSIQPTMTAFTTCFVGSLKSSDMMACKDNQYRSNEDWKRIRHENKEQKMGRGSNASYSRGRGHGPMSRGSSNGFVPQRGRGRGFSDGFRGRGFSQGHRGRGFSDDRGRGSEGFQGRGRGSEGFQGRGRGRGFDRSGREDSQNDRRGLGNVQAESKKQGSLHPSWEASKKRKQEQKAVLQAFEGKKIKFDD